MKEKKPDRNEVARQEVKSRFAVIAECKRLAEQIPDQDALDAILAQKENLAERKQLFTFLSKFITSFHPQFLTERRKTNIIQPKMIVEPENPIIH